MMNVNKDQPLWPIKLPPHPSDRSNPMTIVRSTQVHSHGQSGSGLCIDQRRPIKIDATGFLVVGEKLDLWHRDKVEI